MLFIHDHTFVKNDEKYYTTGSLNQIVMNRYKKWFGNVSVFANYRISTEKDIAYIREENRVDGIDFNLVLKKNSIFNLIRVRKKLKEMIKKSDYIVIRMSIFGALGVYYAKRYKKKYLIEMVACPWDSLWYHSIKGKMLAPFMTLLTKKICKEAPYVTYVTKSFLQSRYPTNGKSIDCSDVVLDKIDNEELNKRLDKIQKCNIKNLKICTVANVAVKYKGQSDVIESLLNLKKSGLEYEYWLLGGGNPERLKMISEKNDVNDLVKIIGPKPHNEIFNYLKQIDLYIQPSYQEGLPRAVIEAMSVGCPVIGTNTGGIPELLNKECIYDKGNKTELQNILLNIDKNKLITYSKENFDNAKQYKKDILDMKRENFYYDFINDNR